MFLEFACMCHRVKIIKHIMFTLTENKTSFKRLTRFKSMMSLKVRPVPVENTPCVGLTAAFTGRLQKQTTAPQSSAGKETLLSLSYLGIDFCMTTCWNALPTPLQSAVCRIWEQLSWEWSSGEGNCCFACQRACSASTGH